MTKTFVASLIVLSTACAYVPPSPVAPDAVPLRTPVQLTIRIAGPDNWYKDRLFAVVDVYDQNGATIGAVVACDSTDGIFEPRQFNTFNRSGVLVNGIKVGSTITCRIDNVQASYRITELDWRVIDVGGGKPAPTPAPPAPPKSGE